MLFEHLKRYLDRTTKLRFQVPFVTSFGRFRVDGMMSNKGERVVIECDGREFHDARKDARRDAALLKGKHVEHIVRFTGAQINNQPFACIRALQMWFTRFFTERGGRFLEAAANWLEFDDDDERVIRGRFGEGRFDSCTFTRRSR